MTTDSKQPTEAAKRRKPYRAPVLTVYGSLGKLTRSLAGNGVSDGMGGSGMSSTSA